jgi:hypothetical protein
MVQSMFFFFFFFFFYLIVQIVIDEFVQALLPIRVGLSLYLSPMFSRAVVEPIRLGGLRLLGRRPKSL